MGQHIVLRTSVRVLSGRGTTTLIIWHFYAGLTKVNSSASRLRLERANERPLYWVSKTGDRPASR